MNVKRIIALIICLLFVFSGGCLFEVDEELDNAQVIIKYKDTAIEKKAVISRIESILSEQGATLPDIKDTDYWSVFRDDAIHEMAVYEIAIDKAAQLGLDKLDEATAAKIDDQIDSVAKIMVESSVKAAVDANPSLDYDEEFARQFEQYLSSYGYTAASFRHEIEREHIFNKLKDYYSAQITVSDEDVRSDYESNLELQKGNIENNAEMIELQLQFGTKTLFYPEGYKFVKHILIRFEDDDIISDAYEAYVSDDTALYRQAVSRGMDAVRPKLDAIMERLDSGESFDSVMNDNIDIIYLGASEDSMVIGPYSTVDIPDYKETALALTREGQYSQPFGTYLGAYIIYCESLLEGEVPFEDIREELHNTMLQQRQAENWTQMSKEWVETALADGTLKMYADKL
ncbi:MAG: hypothetical protein WDA65_07610 [Christensenellales bacterium]